MLGFKKRKNHAGIMLTGDYLSLKTLHQAVHDVSNESALYTLGSDKWLLALAYDVRHAYQGQRETLEPPKHIPEIGLRFGVDILWPTLLVQARQLRVGLGYMPHKTWHQAIVYDLEAVIESALEDDFPTNHAAIRDQWQHLGQMDLHEVDDRYTSRGGLYCSWTKAQRAKGLPTLLESYGHSYEKFYDLLKDRRPELIDPADWAAFEDPNNWVDPTF